MSPLSGRHPGRAITVNFRGVGVASSLSTGQCLPQLYKVSPTQNSPLVYCLLAVENDSNSGSKDAKKALGCGRGGRVKELVTCQGHVTCSSVLPHLSQPLFEVSAWYFLSIENPLLPPTNRIEETIFQSHFSKP